MTMLNLLRNCQTNFHSEYTIFLPAISILWENSNFPISLTSIVPFCNIHCSLWFWLAYPKWQWIVSTFLVFSVHLYIFAERSILITHPFLIGCLFIVCKSSSYILDTRSPYMRYFVWTYLLPFWELSFHFLVYVTSFTKCNFIFPPLHCLTS